MRTEIAITQLDPAAPVEYLTTAGDAANGHQVAKSRLAFIRVENGGAAPCTVSVLPGDPQAGAFLAHAGNGLDVTVPAGETRIIGELDSARFSQGHYYHVNVDVDDGVVLGAVRRPGGA